ncbi:MAG: guanylate kinase [Patescibacteria group bacterium]
MGQLIIISSPSGGGKDAVIRELIKKFPNSVRLTTTTTRPPRPHEQNGIEYFFVSPDEFKKRLNENKFIEHNIYSDNYYGVERKNLEEPLKKYDFVFTNVEVHGKENIDKAGFPSLSVFLMPESMEVLKERIERRGGINDPKIIAKRLEQAKNEVEQSKNYDFRVVNKEGELSETVDKVAKFIVDKKAELV